MKRNGMELNGMEQNTKWNARERNGMKCNGIENGM